MKEYIFIKNNSNTKNSYLFSGLLFLIVGIFIDISLIKNYLIMPSNLIIYIIVISLFSLFFFYIGIKLIIGYFSYNIELKYNNKEIFYIDNIEKINHHININSINTISFLEKKHFKADTDYFLILITFDNETYQLNISDFNKEQLKKLLIFLLENNNEIIDEFNRDFFN